MRALGQIGTRRPVALLFVAGGVATIAGACAGDDDDSGGTLPPIVTTTTTTTVVVTTTGMQRFYEIRRGDTLGNIARAYNVTVQSIVDLNGLENPDDIQAGQVIEIPSGVVLDATLPVAATTVAPVPVAPAPGVPVPTTAPG